MKKMTVLKELQKAIDQLQLQKEDLIKKIQEYGWQDDRPTKKIPATHIADILNADAGFIEPEKAPLPSNASSIYQHWYSAVRTIIEKNQPSRIEELDSLYSSSRKEDEPGIKQLLAMRHISKYQQFSLMDIINHQFEILSAVLSHLRFSIYDVELTAYSVLMDDELAAAQYLLKNGFLRVAGALAGVILERHLKNLLRKHTPPIKYKEKDTLSPLNDLCKETIYDLVAWRKMQHLIRS